jgi:hypothetical protein
VNTHPRVAGGVLGEDDRVVVFVTRRMKLGGDEIDDEPPDEKSSRQREQATFRSPRSPLHLEAEHHSALVNLAMWQ